MLEPILQQLRTRLSEYTSLNKAKRHYDALQNQLKRKQEERKELLKKLQKEERDVEQLEGKSIKKLFHNVLGNKEQQLDKERQEYLDASLLYNTCIESIELLEFEIQVLSDKVTRIPGIEKDIKGLKEARTQEILHGNQDSVQQALQKVLVDLDNCIHDRQEHLEALSAGKKALSELNIVANHLKKAKDWGEWDMMDKRRNSSYMKYSAIDRARSHIPRAQMNLNVFKRELLDVGMSESTLVVSIEDFGGFTNVFFDNIITDWIMQQKLTKSINSISRSMQIIHEALVYLDNKLEEFDQKYQALIMTKDEIILRD